MKFIEVGDSSSAIKYLKHTQIEDCLILPIKDLYRKSIDSLAPFYLTEIILEWRNVSSAFVAEMMSEFYSFYTFYIDKKLIGLAGFPKRGFLQLFYFHPDYQRMGYGSKCLQFIENDNNQNRDNKIGLRAHHRAAPFYQKNGYTQIGESVFQLGMHALPVAIMEKTFIGLVEGS